MNDPVAIGVLLAVALVAMAGLMIFMAFGFLWLQSRTMGFPVPMTTLVGMWFRKSNPNRIVNSYLMARRSGLDVSTLELEAFALAGGDVVTLVREMITAHQAGQRPSIREFSARLLAGQDRSDTTADLPDPH